MTTFVPRKLPAMLRMLGPTMLMSGSGLVAKAVTVLGGLGMIWLYSPASFGIFATYLATIFLVNAVSSGQYEVAIVLERRGERVAILARAALGLCIVSTMIFIVLALWIGDDLGYLLARDPRLILAAGIGIVLNKLLRIGELISIRNERYRLIAFVQVIHALVLIGIQATLGLVWNMGALGLIAGEIVAVTSVGLLYLLRLRKRREGLPLRDLTLGSAPPALSEWRECLRDWRDLPRLHTLSALLMNLAQQAPILALGSLASPAVAGVAFLAIRVLEVPNVTIALAGSRVLMQRLSAQVQGNHPVIPDTRPRIDTLVRAVALALALAYAVVFVASDFVDVVFGARWAGTETFLQILCGHYVLLSMAQFLTPVFSVARREQDGLMLQAAFAGAALIAVIAFWLGLTPTGFVALYALLSGLRSAALIWRARVLMHRLRPN
jgi:O-antigen/teichoic acid export membrane protein